VTIKDIDFSAKVVRIHRSDTVRWLFRDGATPHNVTSRGRPRFRSSVSRQGGSYSVRFDRRGTYRYVCTIHPSMTGRVVVS
jgi:plastocyanin